jgi:hypothetical protein
VNTVTIPGLVEILRRIKTAQLVGIVAVTRPAMSAAGNPFHGRITQVTRATGLVNFTAAGGANNAAGHRNPRPPGRSWGKRLPECPLATRTDSAGTVFHYLSFSVCQRSDVFFDTDTRRRIATEKLRPHLRHRGRMPRGAVKDFRLDRVAELRLAAQAWAVLPLWETLQQFLTERV